MIRYTEVEQNTPQWLSLREEKDTASQASAMMGASKKVTRNELLHMKATKEPQVFSSWVKDNLLDKGHAVESAIRKIAERIIGKKLYAETVGSDEYPNLIASCDGLTMCGTEGGEFKLFNKEKFECVLNGAVPQEDVWQVVQQLVVTRAKRWLYVVSDGTEENTASIFVTLSPVQEMALIAGWRQFNEDRKVYVPQEKALEVIGKPVTDLPAVFVQVEGKVAIKNNLELFAKSLNDFIDNRLITDPRTDQDFANLDLQIKALKKAEAALDAAEEQMLAQVCEVDQIKKHKEMLHALARKNRLIAEKLMDEKKASIKLDIRLKAVDSITTYHEAIAKRLLESGIILPRPVENIAEAMKGKRTVETLQNAADTEVARVKIEITALAEKIDAGLSVLRSIATGYEFLFRDRQELVMKDAETLALIAEKRVSDHKAEKERELEQERERIRKEEAERVQREHEAEQQRIANELAERERAAAGTTEPVATDPAPLEPVPEVVAAEVATGPTSLYHSADHAVDQNRSPSNVNELSEAIGHMTQAGIGATAEAQAPTYDQLLAECARYRVALERIQSISTGGHRPSPRAEIHDIATLALESAGDH